MDHDERYIESSAAEETKETQADEAATPAPLDEAEAAENTEEAEESEEDEDDDGGPQHPRSIGKRAPAPHRQHREESPLAAMSPQELLDNYASCAVAHQAEIENGCIGSALLARLSALREEMEKRCILDILLPLLAHVNPCVQVTAAIDILGMLFERSDQALHVLQIAKTGRGLVPFIAGTALDAYVRKNVEELPLSPLRVDAVLSPQTLSAPRAHAVGLHLLQETSTLYASLHEAIRYFNQLGQHALLPLPARLYMWDGKEHRGTFISIPEHLYPLKIPTSYGQHVGMGEYQIYRAIQLSRAPADGERYIVRKSGALEPYTQTREYARQR